MTLGIAGLATAWFLRRSIRVGLSGVSIAILTFGYAHPRVLRAVHVSLNAVPDLAYALLGLAGLSFLFPEFIKKLEGSRITRRGLFALFVVFSASAIVVNAIKGEEQEYSQTEQQGKVDAVNNSVKQVLQFLVANKGQVSNEAERRKQILETLRDEYVISRPNAPTSMLTGPIYPPSEWINRRLRELGEKWFYIPSESRTTKEQEAAPPAIELMIAVGNDEASRVTIMSKPEYSWYEEERNCARSFKCYPHRDFANGPIELAIGDKGWARIFFSVFNVGGSTIPHPNVIINVANGHDLSLNQMDERQSYRSGSTFVEYPPTQSTDLLPFYRSRNAYDYVVDVSVGPTINNFSLVFQMYAENLTSKAMLVPFRVVRN